MKSQSLLLLLACLLITGCGPSESVPEIVSVTGTLTMNGQPLDQVKVSFMPDGENGNQNARSSWAETDSEGKYVLKYQLPGDERDGAAVGAHKVVLRDLIPNRSRGEQDEAPSATRRFDRKYTSATTTNLEANVKAGDTNVFDFEVDENN